MGWIAAGQSWVADWLQRVMPAGGFKDLVIGGGVAGVGGVLVFLPQILILFFFIGLLEDTGYLARAAFIIDRLMQRVGLHGKSFVPMLNSFACAIPGIMSTRTIENPKDRLVTILVAPLMSCYARLPVYTLMIAVLLSERRDIEDEPINRDVLLALGAAALPMLIILVQNDTGTILIMGAITISMIAVAGARTRWVVGLIGGSILGVLVAIQVGLLQQYQVQRLTSFMNPSADVGSAAYNANQARIAIGGGGLTGWGLFNGPQTQGRFVPVNESDFVFTVAGEELGFIGSVVLIGLLAVILWRAFWPPASWPGSRFRCSRTSA